MVITVQKLRGNERNPDLLIKYGIKEEKSKCYGGESSKKITG
jgi:hypothetical protein